MGQDFRNPNYKEGNPLEPMYVGQRIKYRITKNKVGGKEGATASVDYYYDEGLDIYGNTIQLAEHVGIMTGGGWKSLVNPVTGEVIARYQGLAKWKDALHNDEKLWATLYLMTTLAARQTPPEEMMEIVEREVGTYEPGATETEPTED